MDRLGFVLIVVICVTIMPDSVIFAQDVPKRGGIVRVQVTDTTPAQNPIEDVEVKIVAQDDSKEFTATTDANGNYEYSDIPEGYYLIRIFKKGYDARIQQSISVVNGGYHSVHLRTSKKSNIKRPFGLQPTRMNTVMYQRIESLRQRLSENIGKLYCLRFFRPLPKTRLCYNTISLKGVI